MNAKRLDFNKYRKKESSCNCICQRAGQVSYYAITWVFASGGCSIKVDRLQETCFYLVHNGSQSTNVIEICNIMQLCYVKSYMRCVSIK